MTSMEYIRDYYKVPAEVGRLVKVGGKQGVIVGARNAYILVNFDEDRAGMESPCHPTSEVEYGEIGRARKMTRSQQRYRDYLRSEIDCSFAEWLGIGG